jgi:hypothetical protein
MHTSVIRHGSALARTLLLLGLLPNPCRSDTLVYSNGDRAKGKQISHAGGRIVFLSTHFGELNVPAKDAVVEFEYRPPVTDGTGPVAPAVAASSSDSNIPVEAFSSTRWWAPWTGKISVAMELIQDSSDRTTVYLDGRIEREWPKDEVKLESNYEYRKESDNIVTDLLKATGYWRHDLPRNRFLLYRPIVQWNRSFRRDGVHSPYVLLQQDIGAGLTLVDRDDQKLRIGVAETFFDAWVTAHHSHLNTYLESAFIEAEYKLPRDCSLKERGVLFYSFKDGTSGWENTLEINRRITPSITIGLQHQNQRNPSKLNAQEYQRLRLLLGYEF